MEAIGGASGWLLVKRSSGYLSVARTSLAGLRYGAPIALSFSRNSPVGRAVTEWSAQREGWSARGAGFRVPSTV